MCLLSGPELFHSRFDGEDSLVFGHHATVQELCLSSFRPDLLQFVDDVRDDFILRTSLAGSAGELTTGGDDDLIVIAVVRLFLHESRTIEHPL